ncbi:Uu.00g146870.m01.CDS01 [Anthostomella pinea]|uniref:Uu.00g146870.m01.CDS01 n=1 Tax=Anthostomella pinea TaxID=933095 RepID=A0AAI8YJL0_9PEZI|nr:Uu.00g146870.m01.CDS01 [Anthostomella pinea]
MIWPPVLVFFLMTRTEPVLAVSTPGNDMLSLLLVSLWSIDSIDTASTVKVDLEVDLGLFEYAAIDATRNHRETAGM